MSTQVRQPEVTTASAGTAGRHWAVVLVVGLLAAVVGLGLGYLAFSPDQGSEVNPEVQAMLDDYTTALTAGDADAVLALLTDDAHFYVYDDISAVPESVVRNSIETWMSGIDPGSEPMVAGEGQEYDVAMVGTSDDDEYVFVYRIEPFDGGMLFSYIGSISPVR